MAVKTHEFEGEQLTVKQIQARVQGLSENTVREKLAQGMTTRMAMLSAQQKYRKPNYRQQFTIGKPNPQRQRITSSRVFK